MAESYTGIPAPIRPQGRVVGEVPSVPAFLRQEVAALHRGLHREGA